MPKFVKILSYILLIISFLSGLVFYILPSNEVMIDVILYLAYIFFAIAIIASLGMPLAYALKNPKGIKQGLIKVGAVILVFAVAFLLSSGDPLATNIEPAPSTLTLKITDTGLYVTYLLATISVLAIVLGGVVNLVKNR